MLMFENMKWNIIFLYYHFNLIKYAFFGKWKKFEYQNFFLIDLSFNIVFVFFHHFICFFCEFLLKLFIRFFAQFHMFHDCINFLFLFGFSFQNLIQIFEFHFCLFFFCSCFGLSNVHKIFVVINETFLKHKFWIFYLSMTYDWFHIYFINFFSYFSFVLNLIENYICFICSNDVFSVIQNPIFVFNTSFQSFRFHTDS